jgi:cytochrome c oxidase cbb3-type subunit 2
MRPILALLVLAFATRVGAQGASSAALQREGAQVYGIYCVGCHGANGDGRGAAADMLLIKPRDFTKGIFKFRSTPWATLPTDQDLMRTITYGLAPSSMPEFGLVPERQRWAVIAYVKGFYPEWDAHGSGSPIAVPRPPASLGSAAAVARGQELYVLLECGTCHGPAGRGDGPSAPGLAADAWGNAQHPANFTRGRLKSGPEPGDIYRTFMTGVYGTAMPSYADIFAEPDGENIREGDAWNLVSYVMSLRKETHP